MVSTAEVSLIYEVIPLIDTITTLLDKTINDPGKHASIRHAANTALAVLNKYYSFTDNTCVYRIAMRKLAFIVCSCCGTNSYILLVLHPAFKVYYFYTKNWEAEWIEEALRLVHEEWRLHYKPTAPPPPPPPQTAPIPRSRGAPKPNRTRAPSQATRGSNVSYRTSFSLSDSLTSIQVSVKFAVQINYGHAQVNRIDALDKYLEAAAEPDVTDPIAYWSQQRAAARIAARTIENLEAEALAQMALDYLSAPGKFFYSLEVILIIFQPPPLIPRGFFPFQEVQSPSYAIS